MFKLGFDIDLHNRFLCGFDIGNVSIWRVHAASRSSFLVKYNLKIVISIFSNIKCRLLQAADCRHRRRRVATAHADTGQATSLSGYNIKLKTENLFFVQMEF